MALYDQIGAVYDLVYPDTVNRVPFVRDTLHALGASNVLELGAGTGLYLKPLHDSGLEAVGLDVSAAMIDAARAKDPGLVLHLADATSFALDRRFDAILALSSFFVVLDSDAAFEQCLARCVEHLAPGGHLLAELPNHEVEIAALDGRQETICSADDAVALVIQYRKTATHWTEAWHLFEARQHDFHNRTIHCSERLYDPERMQARMREHGLALVETWGDLLGNPYDALSSPRRVWLWKRA